MRGLSMLGTGKVPAHETLWCGLQQSQIDQLAGANTAHPLFPGSMLFNQIMLPLNTGGSRVDVDSLIPETLDPVFEFCSTYDVERGLTGALVIDAGQTIVEKCTDTLARIISDQSSADKIVLLGSELSSLVNLLDTDKPIVTLTPERYSASALHGIYRLAKHTVFIDTLRAMDAAHTGCSCSVIFTSEKLQSAASNIWVQSLGSAIDCVVRDVSGRVLTADTEHNLFPFAVVDNNQAALAQLCKQVSDYCGDGTPANDSQVHWLDCLTEDVQQAVIRLPDSGADSIGLLDKKTVAVRKLVKLRQDPYAFLSDSKINLLRRAATWFQPKRKAG